MTAAAVLAWINIAQVAVPAGIATVQTITGWIKASHAGQMSDADLNAILVVIFNESDRRLKLALAGAATSVAIIP